MRPARQPRTIGAREAQSILGVSRTKLLELAASGELAGRLVDRPGTARHWAFKRPDVLELLAKGAYRRQKPKQRKQRRLWQEYFGAIPAGFTPAFRDGDRTNTGPKNLCLLPLKAPKTPPDAGHTRHRFQWTKERLEFLRKEYPNRARSEIAEQLGVSLASLTRQARRLRLRKGPEFLRQQARIGHRLPLGTQRVHEHTNTIWIKVSYDGAFYDQWRPKQQVIWEAANNRKVARGWCVIFKDGDKRNFDPLNLELMSKRERSAEGFARFFSYPKELQAVIKLNAKLGREIVQKRECDAKLRSPPQKNDAHRRSSAKRWTADMDDVLYRDYPTKPVEQLTQLLGVSLSSLRQRAKRLQVRRLPETIVAEARAASLAMAH